MTDTPHRKTSSSKRRPSHKEQTNWDIIGIAAAISVVFVGLMGYAAFCPWNPFADERDDASVIAERLQKVGSVVIGAAEPEAPAPEQASGAQ